MAKGLAGNPRIADLKRRYGGRISGDVTGRAATEVAVIVTDLMKEWNPISTSILDLKAIMGTPTKEELGVLVYVFDRGFDGVSWRFTVVNDTVAGVERVPFD